MKRRKTQIGVFYWHRIGTAGTRGRTFIVNLPGNPRAIGECLPLVLPAIRKALRHSRGDS